VRQGRVKAARVGSGASRHESKGRAGAGAGAAPVKASNSDAPRQSAGARGGPRGSAHHQPALWEAFSVCGLGLGLVWACELCGWIDRVAIGGAAPQVKRRRSDVSIRQPRGAAVASSRAP